MISENRTFFRNYVIWCHLKIRFYLFYLKRNRTILISYLNFFFLLKKAFCEEDETMTSEIEMPFSVVNFLIKQLL